MPVFNRQRAVEYALRWALARNREFPDYSGHGEGGDCTNFVSQVMLAGGWTEVRGLKIDRTAWWYLKERSSFTWAGADPFALFLRFSGRATVCGRDELALADIVQIRNPDGRLHHTMVVTGITPRRGEHREAIDEVYVSYHSTDRKNNLLNMIEMAPAYEKHTFVYWKVSDMFIDPAAPSSPFPDF
jgi:hypothetical protein